MPRVIFVKRARVPNPVVTEGDIRKAQNGEIPDAASYYWWKFRFGGKRFSKTPPRASQLTQSAYYGAIYDLQDEMADASPTDQPEIEGLRDDWANRIREIGEEQADNRMNMPDQLQDSETGELLERRNEAMEDWASQLEDVDLGFEPDEDGDQSEDEQLEEWLAEKMDEIHSAEPEIE